MPASQFDIVRYILRDDRLNSCVGKRLQGALLEHLLTTPHLLNRTRFEHLRGDFHPRQPRPERIVRVPDHTDRIGSAAYNKKLSEARATTVKDYLQSKGVDQKLIFWEGKGFANPVPVTKFCDNKMSRKQLIECLAPNRRVDIEAVGQKPKPEPKPKAKPEAGGKPEAKPEAKPKP